MTDTTSQPRSPLAMFFSLGFRPFFLGAALWAVAVMALWLAVATGLFVALYTTYDAYGQKKSGPSLTKGIKA